MEYELNDIVEMKKQHPCGTNRWQITRMGADIKIKCLKCDNNIMMPRREFNKKIKKIIEKNSEFTSSEKNFKEIKENLENKLTEEARKIKENTNYFNVVTYNRKTLTDSFSKIKKKKVLIFEYLHLDILKILY